MSAWRARFLSMPGQAGPFATCKLSKNARGAHPNSCTRQKWPRQWEEAVARRARRAGHPDVRLPFVGALDRSSLHADRAIFWAHRASLRAACVHPALPSLPASAQTQISASIHCLMQLGRRTVVAAADEANSPVATRPQHQRPPRPPNNSRTSRWV